MRYETTLLRGWGRREWLTVVIIAVTTAFLIGSATLLVTAGSYTETLEDDLGSSATVTHVDSYAEATERAGESAVVLRFARITEQNETRRVVGIPPDAPREIESASVAWRPATVPQPPTSGLAGPVNQPGVDTFRQTPLAVNPGGGNGLFPPTWYVGSAETVGQLNETGALILEAETGGYATAENAIPLIGTLPFLIGGVRQVIQTLGFGAVGGGALILIVVYSVTRMSIRDRMKTVRVVRASGGAPRRLLITLILRAVLLTGVGVGTGIITGIATTRGVITAAAYAGIPVSLTVTPTPEIIQLIALLSGFLLIIGILAGALASLPIISCDPAAIGRRERDVGEKEDTDFSKTITPTFFGWRSAVPTTTTLSVFMLVILLTTAIGTAVAPLATTSSGTVVESGAPHPLNSRISEEYADTLRAQGVSASPEILYAQTRGREPYLIRGANFSAFSRVTEAQLTAGRSPQNTAEAVIGESLARTLDMTVGEQLIIGGSVSPGVHQLEVVGTFSGEGITDDQLVIPLKTAQGLATRDGSVHLIRTQAGSEGVSFESSAEATNESQGIVVTDLRGPSSVIVNESFNMSIKVRNLASRTQSRTISVQVGPQSRAVNVEIAPQATTQRSISFRIDQEGEYTARATGVTRGIRVSKPTTLTIPDAFPERAPPGATILIPSVTAKETVVEDATAHIGNRQRTTGSRGAAIMGVPDAPGQYDVRVSKPGYTPAMTTLLVDPQATQQVRGQIRVDPETGTAYTQPEITVRVANPWGTFLVRNLTLTAPGVAETRRVEMPVGNVTQITLGAAEIGLDDQLAPGRYPLALYADESLLARTTYTVEDRSNEPTSINIDVEGDYAEGTAVGRAIENVFGNVQVLFLVMIVLAGVSTVGGTTATFAHAVQTNRRKIGIYRATGATRRQILQLLAGDALRIAIPAAAVSFVGMYALVRLLSGADLLVVFGVRLRVPLTLFLPVSLFVGAIIFAVTSAFGAAWAFLSGDVTRLLRVDE